MMWRKSGIKKKNLRGREAKGREEEEKSRIIRKRRRKIKE